MLKGGYKVILFDGYKLTDTPVTIPGIYNTIQNNYEKMLLCSGVSSADYLYDDNVGFCTIDEDGGFEIQFGNQKIKVSEDDEVTMTPSGGGGGGVSDYNDLTSKPKINNVTLTGNKSSSDLGLQAAEQGKGLSTNDFTDTLKSKLDGIEAGAEVNVQPDWEQDDSSADDYIKNKPTIPEVKDDLSDLDDVNIFNPQNNNVLKYDSTSQKWVNGVGGGGGTSDYTDLTNKPKINDVELIGNKSLNDLGIQASESGKGLSTNDFTNTLKSKLDGIEAGAEVNVQPDWEQDDTSADDYIKNKPTIPEVKDDLSDLDDVSISNPQNNNVLKYDSTSQKWVNGVGGGGGSNSWSLIEYRTGVDDVYFDVSQYTEVMVVLIYENRMSTGIIPISELVSTDRVLYMGGGYTSATGTVYNAFMNVLISLTHAKINSFEYNGTNVGYYATIKIYAR